MSSNDVNRKNMKLEGAPVLDKKGSSSNATTESPSSSPNPNALPGAILPSSRDAPTLLSSA
jgi:hypothetical protein